MEEMNVVEDLKYEDDADWLKMYVTLLDCIERALYDLPYTKENEVSRQCLLDGLLKAEEIFVGDHKHPIPKDDEDGRC